MDQKEIDDLIAKSQGSIAEFSKKQEELIKHLSEQSEPPPSAPNPVPPPRKGKVMGQLSRVTEEAEAGTNMVMGYLENVLSVLSKQQDFIKDISAKYLETPNVIDVAEVLAFLKDNNTVVEELIYNAMDAFQFQDIGRQKLMKVMYTLSKLNEYLNELLGGHEEKGRVFGSAIEKKTLEQDKEKGVVDNIVSEFQEKEAPAKTPAATRTTATTAAAGKNENTAVDNSDIDDIIAEFQRKNKKV